MPLKPLVPFGYKQNRRNVYLKISENKFSLLTILILVNHPY